MNEKNSLGLDKCFLETNEPFELFDKWYEAAKKKEINDPNALALATSSKNNVPSVRMVLLKDFSKNGFVFYTNLNSQKGNEIKENPSVSMCFHWKSLLRQVRINGKVTPVQNTVADKYYNSRAYESRIGAWASNQSSILNDRQELINSIDKFKEKFNEKDNVPRPDHWSGWNLKPDSIEFWLDGENRIHERLKFLLNSDGSWKKVLLSP
ncbi:pyridoxamine 5'-phosphate oxidase [Candidatus Pelagibacter sp.]|jgi:pyridoxamine 5'-phosphate oxidase|nr:pyridoxamine 5'-phosphate oxidase [Candidatus Pelagibacter sp.]